MTTLESRKYNIGEYLKLGEFSGEKFEYLNGEVKDISGATSDHSTISINVLTHFHQAFKSKKFSVLGSQQMIRIPTFNGIVHPDLVIVEGDFEVDKNFTNILTNPKIIVEIISDSPKGRDKFEKFHLYREIPSLCEYIVINASKVFAQSFFNIKNDSWRISEATNEEDYIHLCSLKMNLSVRNIYQEVSWFKGTL